MFSNSITYATYANRHKIEKTIGKFNKAKHSSKFAMETNSVFDWGVELLKKLAPEGNEQEIKRQHDIIAVGTITIAMAM